MNWQTLYSAQRSGDRPGKEANPDAARTSYIRDYDRIIFSSAFRRLQNKTQVFPLPGAVFVHNRLTHSLEVASVGRSLGKAVGDAIAKKHFPDNSTRHVTFPPGGKEGMGVNRAGITPISIATSFSQS